MTIDGPRRDVRRLAFHVLDDLVRIESRKRPSGVVTGPVDACILGGTSGVANELNRVGERRLGDGLFDRGRA